MCTEHSFDVNILHRAHSHIYKEELSGVDIALPLCLCKGYSILSEFSAFIQKLIRKHHLLFKKNKNKLKFMPMLEKGDQ